LPASSLLKVDDYLPEGLTPTAKTDRVLTQF
jgi:hypothetical protein